MFVFNQSANGYHQFIQNIRFLKTKKILHQSLVVTENELATKLMRSLHQNAIFVCNLNDLQNDSIRFFALSS
ncbi:hypothetical protein C7Y66_20360 [Chroococcidiopsis sp. CCALA 051]|nr:hypothetical protein C7Y66_20360 [Chroococcidiopsis sp. CCALA 051]